MMARLRLTNRRLQIVLVIAIATGAVLLWRLVWARPSVEAASISELSPIWEDSYIPLSEGRPPWPLGLSREQTTILEHAERVVIAKISGTGENESFHGHLVLRAVEFSNQRDAEQFAEAVIQSSHADETRADEFYPVYGVRIWSDSNILDLLIDNNSNELYAFTESDKRFCAIDGANTFLDDLEQIASLIPDEFDGR